MDKVTIATTFSEVEALRSAWKRCAPADVDADIDAFLTLLDCSGHGASPHVVHIERSDHDGSVRDLLAVARLELATLPVRLGYRKIWEPRLPAVVMSFGGFVGVRDEDDAAALMNELRQPLAQGKAEIMILRNVVPGDPLHRVASHIRLSHIQASARRWAAPIASSLDEFLKTRSSKTRQKLRREDRIFLAEYEGRIEVRCFDDPKDLDCICRDAERVASKTYQRGLGAGFEDTPATRAFIRLCLERGWHRTWMLYLDGKPTAFWSGVAFRGIFIVTALGFDPDFSRYSVGRYTMFRMVEDLCEDPLISQLDLGPGDADYKMAFANAIHVEATWLVGRPSLRGAGLVLMLSMTAMVNRWGKHLLQERGWGARLKKIWRVQVARPRSWAAKPGESAPEKVV